MQGLARGIEIGTPGAVYWIDSPLPETAVKTKLITIDPEIHSGTPVFVGTRVPVKALFDHLEAGDSLRFFWMIFRPSAANWR